MLYGMIDNNCCPVCEGPLMFLGQLGNLVHARCRNCGADFSWEAARSVFDADFESAEEVVWP